MKKSKIFLIIGLIFLLVSVGLVIYPLFSEFVNNQLAKGTITQYDNQVNSLTDKEKNDFLRAASRYNTNLSNVVSDSFSPDAFKVSKEYMEIMNVTDDGLIGSVTIPKIDCSLPIYHGSSEKELDRGAIHMANTSFPIGGKNTHAVISAHTAYPGKEFFNRLTELEKNDIFEISVLGDTLYYKVSDIYVVLPNDSEKLRVVKGEDLCTLVTCTPYSVNTHRLLVRGTRIYPDDITEEEKNTLEPPKHNYAILIILVLIIIATLILILFRWRKRRLHDKVAKGLIKGVKKSSHEKLVQGGSGAGFTRFSDLSVTTAHKDKEADHDEK